MPLPIHVSLLANQVNIGISELMRVAAALTQQVVRDFGPIWHVTATVDAFTRFEDIPLDSWPVIIVPDVKDAGGFHEDKNGQPFALVEAGDDWSLTASHETLEMLADPFGRRLRAGATLAQAVAVGAPKHRVRYLVEVCDPSEAAEFSYQANGVPVSDFYTPDFFSPVTTPGVRYSFTGAISDPLTVLKGGYISWLDLTTNHLMQFRNFPDADSKKPHVIDLSSNKLFEALRASTCLRAAVDRVTKVPKQSFALKGEVKKTLDVRRNTGRKAQLSRADSLHKSIARAIGK